MSLRTILGRRSPRGGGIARALPVGGRVPFSGPVRGRPQPPISIGGPGGGVAIGRPVAPPTNIGRPPFTPSMGGARPVQGGLLPLPTGSTERETGVIGRPVGLPMPKYETGLPQADDIVSALPVGPSIPFTPPTDTNELPVAKPLPVLPPRPNLSDKLARPPVGPDGTIFSATPTPLNPARLGFNPNVIASGGFGQPLVPGSGTPRPQTGLTAAELLELSDEELQRYIPRETIGQGVGSTRRTYDFTPSPEEF